MPKLTQTAHVVGNFYDTLNLVNLLKAFYLLFLLGTSFSLQKVTAQTAVSNFKLIKNHIYLEGKINNFQTDSLIFDTGATGLILDSIFFVNSGLQYDSIKKTNIFGTGTENQSASYTVFGQFTFKFQHQSKKYSQIRVTNLKDIIGNSVKGIIGLDSFDEEILEIDYLKQTIRFLIYPLDLSKYQKINSTFQNNRVYIPASIKSKFLDAKIKYSLMLDLGSRYGVTIFNTSVKQDSEYEKLPERESSGFSGKIKCKIDTAIVLLKPNLTRTTTLSFYPTKLFFAPKNSGLVGTDFFKSDILIVDLKMKKLFIKL
jgi:hypothetical protein